MNRYILPAIILANMASAEDIGVCRNIPYSQNNCVRVLACIGDRGLTFDGRARGWDAGTITGAISDGTGCAGTWDQDGPMGTGIGKMSCEDGTDVSVIYYSQDSITGTVVGRGVDTKKRAIRVWSGENVLQFLTEKGAFGPALPCVQGDIPIS